ncbi:MAG TPA: hypothetical protein VLC71_12750 [Thermomonas sp.]|nr:hypothetical protein [Thermomonas sp.]
MPDQDPDNPPLLDMVGAVPVVRLVATQRVFDDAIAMIAVVVRRMLAEGQPHLLVDARQAGFASPSLVDRLRMVRQWADAAGGRVRIVVVARPEFIDPERFGVVAAGKFGLSAQVFEQEADAIAWLHEERLADLDRGHLEE